MNMTITKPVFSYLYNHIVDINNKKMNIVNNFAMDYDKYMMMLNFIKAYIKKLENYVEKVYVVDGTDKLPFVIYHSIVRMESKDGRETHSCSVTLPKSEHEMVCQIQNVTMIPCIEPTAFSLIFKNRGEGIEIQREGKSFKYIIKDIEPNPYIPIVEEEEQCFSSSLLE